MRAETLLLTLLTILCGCDRNPYKEKSDAELHALATTLPLEQRYKLYQDVLHSSIPGRPVLVTDIAAMGPNAREYVLRQATESGQESFLDAMPVIAEFNARCSDKEYATLQAAVQKYGYDDDEKDRLRQRAAVACERGAPPGLK